jgi:hypothetical protein
MLFLHPCSFSKEQIIPVPDLVQIEKQHRFRFKTESSLEKTNDLFAKKPTLRQKAMSPACFLA